MSGIYTGLLMGATNKYWLDIIKKIQTLAGNGEFTWVDAYKLGITKSELSRLKCSNFIIKPKGKVISSKGQTKQIKWKIHPGLISYLNTPKWKKKVNK